MSASRSGAFEGFLGSALGAIARVAQPGRVAAVIVAAALASGIATYLALTSRAPFESADPDLILALLLLNMILGLALTVLVAWRLVALLAARRVHSAGAQLHSRLVLLFSAVAVVPTVLVAVFSAVTLNLGIEAWFSDRVQTAVRSSVRVADAYVDAHKQTIRADIANLADILGSTSLKMPEQRAQFLEIVRVQGAVMGLHAIHILGADGRPVLRVNPLGEVEMPPADPADLAQLDAPGKLITYTDETTDQVRAILRVPWMADGYLYIGRRINPEVLGYQQETRAAISSYERLENNRFNLQFTFVLIYFVVSVLVLLSAVWLGLTFANRIVQPIGRLIGAAERVSNGDLSARVDVGRSGDEIEGLGRAFNRMTGQLQSQRNELIETNRQLDERRRFSEAVLGGVSAGVIGLDEHGYVTALNRSAQRLLARESEQMVGEPISQLMPQLADTLAAAQSSGRARTQIDLVREDGERRLNVQISRVRPERGEADYVITFDDITDLLAAQRTAAWADVARRIAHEIKNPLTPIQLSAERLRRKYKKEVTSDPDVFDQCTDTIIRHVNDIGRMVDEFSSFARMPEPIFQPNNLGDLVRQAVFLQKVALPDTRLKAELPKEPIVLPCDARLIAQVLTNLIKNAGESIALRIAAEGATAAAGEITLRLEREAAFARIDIIDNGTGWPHILRSRLTEPYVTTRKKGTGLGLAIVKKAIEDHAGRIVLADVSMSGEIVETDGTAAIEQRGAVVRLYLPLARPEESKGEGKAEADPPRTNRTAVS